MIKRLLIAVGLIASPAAAAPVPTLSTTEAAYAQAEEDTILIDVRTPSEWARTGMASGAIGLTLQDPDFRAKLEKITGGKANQKVAFICMTGIRSEAATRIAEDAGYTRAYNVSGGMLGRDGWVENGLPVSAAPTD